MYCIIIGKILGNFLHFIDIRPHIIYNYWGFFRENTPFNMYINMQSKENFLVLI